MTDDQDYGQTSQQQRYLGYLLATARQYGIAIPYLPEGLSRQLTSDWIAYAESILPEEARKEVHRYSDNAPRRGPPNGVYDSVTAAKERGPKGVRRWWPWQHWKAFRWLLSIGARAPLSAGSVTELLDRYPIR